MSQALGCRVQALGVRASLPHLKFRSSGFSGYLLLTILGGPLDLVTTFTGLITLLVIPLTGLAGVTLFIRMVIIPVISVTKSHGLPSFGHRDPFSHVLQSREPLRRVQGIQ